MANHAEIAFAAREHPTSRPLARLGRLIDAIGDRNFETTLTDLLEAECGADQIFFFYADKQEPRVRCASSSDGGGKASQVADAYAKGRWFRFDEPMTQAFREASPAPRLYRTDLKRSAAGQLQATLYRRMQLRERILVCGRAADDIIGISMLRSNDRGPFGDDQCAQIEWLAQLAFPLVSKHWTTVNRDSRMSLALTDLDRIETCVAGATEFLPPREAAVCARYLYGQSTAGIAADLAIGQETVVTYRKRLYDRLGIGSHRELLLWYLDLYGSLRSQGVL